MWIPTVNFAKTVKKATCLMTTAQYNSNNSLTLELKWTSFVKINNLDELINIPIKAEERIVIQISFRTQGPNIRQAQSRICFKIYSRSTICCVFKTHKSTRFTAQIHDPCSFWGQICRSENLFTPLFNVKLNWLEKWNLISLSETTRCVLENKSAAVCFLLRFSRACEMRCLSLKGNGTRHGCGTHEKKSRLAFFRTGPQQYHPLV